MMHKSMAFTALALLAAIAVANPVAAAVKPTHQDKGVATVNHIVIPQARIDLNLKAFAQQGQPDSPELRKKIKDELIDLEVIAQEARRKGLDKQPEALQMIEVTTQNILRSAFAQDFVKNHPISEETLKQEYENQKKSLTGQKEYNVAHILVESEKEALAIVSALKNKGEFGKLAAEKSKDQGSKARGGELGWTTPAAFVPPFSEVLIKLQKGQTSAPVQTSFGWHVIKLLDIRDLEIPPYDKVKTDLEKHMQQKALQAVVKALRDKAQVN